MRSGMGVALVWLIAGLLGSAPVAAQQPAPLVTVGVEVTDATPTGAGYSLFVTNQGSALARSVELSNTVPTNTTFAGSDRAPTAPVGGAACASGAPAGTECRWALGDIPPGASHTVRVTYALAQNETAYGEVHTFANTASAQAAGDAGPQSDTDNTLVRTSHVLDQDGHVDDTQPTLNFGSCSQLLVRRDNTLTAFLEADRFSTSGYPFAEGNVASNSDVAGVERLWHAELKAAVVSAPATGLPVAVHRVTSGEWGEGSGNCSGAAGTGDQIRGAAQPQSEPAPAATSTIDHAGSTSWDVRAAFDTVDERMDVNGFELRAAGGSSALNSGDTVTFHSSDATTVADRPRLVTLATRVELGRCSDADPEMSLTRSDAERRIDAFVTDGAERVANDGGDGCPGSPVPDAPVGWELDDDSPDAYIASRDGAATVREVGSSGDVGPNMASTRADAGGRTFVAVRLAEPYVEPADDVETRIAGIAMDQHHEGYSSLPPGGYLSGVCEPGDLYASNGIPQQCPATGEDRREDDAHVSWDYVAAPPIAPPSGGGSGGGGTAPSPPSPQQEAVYVRSIAVQPSKTRAAVGQTVTLAGRLSSASASCAGPREFVEILRRRRGARTLTPFASTSTAADGTFELPIVVDASAEYVAVAPERSGCKAASSDPVGVLGSGRVHAWAARPTPQRAGTTMLRGRVRPALPGSVVLERRAGRRWIAVTRRRVARSGAFSFPVRASRSGRREFRVRWVSSRRDYLGAVSRTLIVRPPRSR